MVNSCSNRTYCTDEFGCPTDGSCPDFIIKRHDTKPSFNITIKDCNDPIDLTDAVVEVSMWANAKLKTAIADSDTYFSLADNIGFQQVSIGDIIVSGKIRNPEQMLVTGFDEDDYLIEVQRAYNGTTASSLAKGTKIKIFRTLNAVGSTEMTLMDITQVDGTVDEDVLTESKLVYDWAANDTCLPGCYYLELKLLKMTATPMAMNPMMGIDTISIVSFISTVEDCSLGAGVEWVRRFPVDKDGFLIKIIDSPTAESLM